MGGDKREKGGRGIARICCWEGGSYLLLKQNFLISTLQKDHIYPKNHTKIYITLKLSFNHRSYILVTKNPKIFSAWEFPGGTSPLSPLPYEPEERGRKAERGKRREGRGEKKGK